MDKPSWTDALGAALGSCVPQCLSFASSNNPNDEDEYAGGGGVLRREGLLADDDEVDADAISLHSHLGLGSRQHGRRRRAPPRQLSLCSGLQGSTAPPGVPASPHRSKSIRRGSIAHARSASTADLLARAALEPAPTLLTDVTEADVERRARRKARKAMRAASSPALEGAGEEGFDGFLGTPFLHVQLSPSPSASAPPPPLANVAHIHAEEDDDAVDLDGGAYARLAPRPTGGSHSGSRSSGRSSGSGSGGVPYSHSPIGAYIGTVKPKKTRTRTRAAKSKSSATSSTLASPPPTPSSTAPGFGFPNAQTLRKGDGFPHALEEYGLGAFTQVTPDGDGDEFDGTPGGGGFEAIQFVIRWMAIPFPALSIPMGARRGLHVDVGHARGDEERAVGGSSSSASASQQARERYVCPLMFIVPHRRLRYPLYPHRRRQPSPPTCVFFLARTRRRTGAGVLASLVEEDGSVEDGGTWLIPACPATSTLPVYPHQHPSRRKIRVLCLFSAPGRVDALSSFLLVRTHEHGRRDVTHPGLPFDVRVARPARPTSSTSTSKSKFKEDSRFASFSSLLSRALSNSRSGLPAHQDARAGTAGPECPSTSTARPTLIDIQRRIRVLRLCRGASFRLDEDGSMNAQRT
ncbi:hypothetical protein B0H13DRAFT_2266947 [Mycena leptocephala]|nr:hypothetical protein B0H13DRAFT_2266947 [Mycena leptocephala]